MKISKYINIRVFLISFAVGLLYIYLSDDYKKVVVVYPTPMNLDKHTYVDNANNCFKYNLKEDTCSSNKDDYVTVGINY